MTTWRISIHNHMRSGRRDDRYDPVVINLVAKLGELGFPMPELKDIEYSRQPNSLRHRVDIYVEHWDPSAMTMLLLGLNTSSWDIKPVEITVEEIDPDWSDVLTWEV